MPTSETADEAAYRAAIRDFVDCHVPARGTLGVVQAYRAVQAFPYRSVADRRPLTALRNKEGACTAKHMVLRDVLRAIGETAVVEIVEGDFASGLPVHDSMGPALQAMIRDGGVIDMHCRVRLDDPKTGSVRHLDATFPPALVRFGFTVDRDWWGDGDTAQAIPKVTVRSEEEDVLGEKERLLSHLDQDTTARRKEFLRLLTEWLAGIDMH